MTYFLMTVVLLNIMPGPAMFYVAQQSINSDLRAVVFSILGIEFGTFLHILASVVGLTVALSNLPFFQMFSKYLCALFLIYLGLSQLSNSPFDKNNANLLGKVEKNNYNSFIKGAVLNVLNPKLLLFFLAMLPQFINTHSNNTGFQIIYMGLTFGLFGGLANIILSILVKTSINKMQNETQAKSIIHYSTGVISGLFILFGIGLIIMAITTK